jgi:aryl-alcohol dehydrogenase-like predicted oxidoreductase
MGAYLTDRGRRILAALDFVAAETGATLAQISLAWLMSRASLTAPIASATSAQQLKELLGALTVTLSPAQIASLTAASDLS